jgi:2-dehydro-3-deoxygluconokinase
VSDGLLPIRAAEDCRYDLVALGEVMLRFDPGEGRIATTRAFAVSEGGGEYNVARGLRRCFGLRTAIVTALADNPVGRLLEDLILQGGVDQSYVSWLPYDGVGRSVRNGLNFVERGFGVRAALGCSDRGHTAAAALKPGDVDWDAVFGDGARWFHCGGIFAALAPNTAALALEAMTAAQRHGTVVSFDLNYRPSLWQASGGTEAAAATNRRLVEQVDVLLGNEEDFSAALGFSTAGVDASHTGLDLGAYEQLHRDVLARYPNLTLVATSLREAHTATRNDWSAVCSTRKRFVTGPSLPNLEILDRVGGGDSFASGLIYGLLNGFDLETSTAYGVAHGALAMTTPGDTSMATLAEVEHVVRGGSARVVR